MPSLPDPLHPALVHVPLGLAVLLPLATVLCLAAIALVATVLAGGALAAEEAGEDRP